MAKITSKVADGGSYQRGFEKLKKRKGSGVCKGCRRYPCRCRGIVLDRADAPAERRGGRARLVERTTPLSGFTMDPEMKAATRVLALAESPREREMFASLLKSEGKMCSNAAIRDGIREAKIRRGF